MKWRKSPVKLENITEQVDYIFSIDECGTSVIKGIKNFQEHQQLFTLSGIKIPLAKFNYSKDIVMALKHKYWNNALFNHERVVFHSRDIRKKQGAFNPRLVDHKSFSQDLVDALSKIEMEIFSVSIDKIKHVESYSTPYPVYELAFEFLLERFCFGLRRENATGILLFESRGRKEDAEILNKVNNLLINGNDFNRNVSFSCIKGVYFNPKKTKNKKQSYWPLEISDLVSYSIHQYVRKENKNKFFKSIENKIYSYPNYIGKGIKIFPKLIEKELKK